MSAIVPALPAEIMTPIDPDELRALLLEDVKWFKRVAEEGEKRWVRLGKYVQQIRDRECWRAWSFETFDQWLAADCASCRRTIYGILSVVDRLPFPPEQLEAIGKSRCYELARVAKHKASALPAVMLDVDLPVDEFRAVVANVLNGTHQLSGKCVWLEVAIAAEDYELVQNALLVAGIMGELQGEGARANGDSIVAICQDFLAGEEQLRILGEIEDARR